MREEGKGEERKKKEGKKKKKKGKKTRQVQAGPRDATPTLGGFDSTPFCHLSKGRGYGHQVGYVSYGGRADPSQGSSLRRD